MLKDALRAGAGRPPCPNRPSVVVSRPVAIDATTLLELISGRAGQWCLLAGFTPLLRPQSRVEPASGSPAFVHVRVRLRGRDALWFTWMLTPMRGTTEVDLAATPDPLTPLARLALVLGGRRWLRRQIEATLDAFAMLAHRRAEGLGDAGRALLAPDAAAPR